MIKAELWSHQQQMLDFAVDRLNDRGYAYWVAGCAVGKTLASYAVADEIRANKTLVLTKKTIIDQAWGGNHARFTEGYTFLPLTKGSSKDKVAELIKYRNERPLIVAVNYETAAIMSAELKAFGFEFVIADESHKLKSHNSKQSQTLALALNNIPYKLAMTGTPWDDRPTDVYGQVRWLAGAYKKGKSVGSDILGSWTGFFEKYVKYRSVDNIKIPIGYINQEELAAVVSPFTIFLHSEDVLTLPPQLDITWNAEWTPELRRVYKDMEKDMIAEYRNKTLVADNTLAQALRLHQLTGGYFATDDGGHFVATPKIDAVRDILDEIGGEPTVIFTNFASDVDALKPVLEKDGYKVKLLVGGTYEHEEFQRGDGDVILVNLSAGNAGIELTRARYVIYYSVGTSRTNYSQSRYRVRRPDSVVELPVTYYHVQLPGSVDVDLFKAMQGKGDVANYLLQGLENRVFALS